MNKIDSSLMRTVLDGVKPSIHKSDSNRCKGNKYITDGKSLLSKIIYHRSELLAFPLESRA